MPLVRRLPGLGGFKNLWRIEYAPVNVEWLNGFEAGTEVTPEMMLMAGLIRSLSTPVKVLGDGALGSGAHRQGAQFSAAAARKDRGGWRAPWKNWRS